MSSEYESARRALSRHLWRHHNRVYGSGTLTDRLEQHGELHALSERLTGKKPSHNHEPPGEHENIFDQAHRMLREGGALDG